MTQATGNSRDISHRHHHRHHHKHHKSKHSPASSSVPTRHVRSTHQIPSETQPSQLNFTLDRRGDAQTLVYGSIDRSKVPRYRPFGHGRIIGLDRGWKIVDSDRVGSGERRVENIGVDGNERDRRRGLTGWRAEDTRSVGSKVLKGNEAGADEGIVEEFADQKSYIPLGRKRRRVGEKRVSRYLEHGSRGDARAVVSDQPRSDRSDNQHDSEAETSDWSSSEESDQVDMTTDTDDAFTKFKHHPDNKKYLELRNSTESNPQDLSVWLDLIEHQERYFLLSTSLSQSALATANDTRTVNLTAAQKRTVTDMRVSLYEKAIATVKTSQAKEALTLGLMKEGAKIWDTDRLRKEWRLVLKGNENKHEISFDLWCEYLNFQQNSVVGFTYERCLGTYLEVLNEVLQSGASEKDYFLAYLTLRLTSFMYEAGFAERAIAVWQGLLEFNLLSPKTSERHSIGEFERFWESECPRVGEDGALGWSSSIEREVPSRSDAALPDLNRESLLVEWAAQEMNRSAAEAMPARTLDDTVEDDPFRVILFSDIKDFVFEVKNDRFLKQAFLNFCRLPPVLDDTDKCRKWWRDPYLIDHTSELATDRLTDPTSLFVPPGSPFHVWRIMTATSAAVLDFAVRALSLLVFADQIDDKLAEYVVALQSQRNSTAARKFAKTLLKRRPNSLLLYNAYALLEVRNGKLDVASNVWSTALAMAASFGSTVQGQKLILWHSWLWSLMEQQRYVYASNLLTEVFPSKVAASLESFQDVSSRPMSSSGQRLRAESYFRDQIAIRLGQRDSSVIELIDLLAMFKYLHSGNKFDTVIEVYQAGLSLLSHQKSLVACERLHQFRARFAQFHALSSKSGYRPMQLLPLFEESRVAFSDNSLFFNLHQIYLGHAGIIDRVRLVNSGKTPATTSTVSCLQAISKEMSRPSYAGSTAYSIRHAFKKATELDSEARNSPTVWLTWLRWEMSLLNDQPRSHRKQAKEVYLSALRSCLWHKELYLQGFSNLLFTTASRDLELAQIYRSLGERGIRVRHDIEDILDDMKEDAVALAVSKSKQPLVHTPAT